MARANLLFAAKISEQAERYQDMVAEMKKIAQMAGEQELSVEERNLLSVGECGGGVERLAGQQGASWVASGLLLRVHPSAVRPCPAPAGR
jgi:14-3-3 protein epsilon